MTRQTWRGMRPPADHATDAGAPTPHEFRAFVEVADKLHFGRAARSIGVAQSSLSEAIRRLEAKFDVVLFERTSRRVALTDAGLALLPRARSVLEEFSAARAAVNEAPASHCPRPDAVRIGVEGCGFERVLRRDLIDGFLARHPGTALSFFEMHGTPRGFRESGADVAFIRSPMVDDKIRVRTLLHESRGLLVPAGHRLASAVDATIDDAHRETFVGVAPQDDLTRDYWMGVEEHHRGPARWAGAANSTFEVFCMVANLGLLSTGTRQVFDAAGAGGVTFVPAAGLSPVRVGLAVRIDERRPIVVAFVEHVVAILGEGRNGEGHPASGGNGSHGNPTAGVRPSELASAWAFGMPRRDAQQRG